MEKYKLECKERNYIFTKRLLIVDCFSFIVIVVGVIFIEGFHLSGNFMIYIIIIQFFVGLIYLLNSFLVFSPKNFKKYGKKEIGYITEADTAVKDSSRYGTMYYHYIEVTYNGKNINIPKVKNNKGFKMLKMLLDPYFIKPKIPIDVYVYKNKLFADLDSVDLSKIKGFDELKDINE